MRPSIHPSDQRCVPDPMMPSSGLRAPTHDSPGCHVVRRAILSSFLRHSTDGAMAHRISRRSLPAGHLRPLNRRSRIIVMHSGWHGGVDTGMDPLQLAAVTAYAGMQRGGRKTALRFNSSVPVARHTISRRNTRWISQPQKPSHTGLMPVEEDPAPHRPSYLGGRTTPALTRGPRPAWSDIS